MTLSLRIDRPLPPSLPAWTADAVFVAGAIAEPIIDLSFVVDGDRRHRAWAFGMPPGGLFWGIVPVSAGAARGSIVVEAQARLADASVASAEIGRVEITPVEPPPATTARPAAASGELIAVCMATFEPNPALFAAQIGSLRAQSDDRWICLISDDASSQESLAAIERVIAGDPRFALSRSPERHGFYRNFERALAMVPADVALVALCDQDDRWHPDKLATLRDAIGGEAVLVYSDMRLVDAGGAVLRHTLWQGRSNNHDDLTSMLVANTITGAATLFRRELLDVLLPFPDTPGFQFHDTWLAVAALATGEVAYVDRPLYDYVQHPGAVFGDVTHGRRHRRSLRPGGPVSWRAAYFHGYLSRAAQAEVVLARSAGRLHRDKRAALERFVGCDRSPIELAALAARSFRTLTGHTETLGSELGLAAGAAWKQTAFAAARRGVPAPGPLARLADATIPGPEHFSQSRLRRWRAAV